MSADGRAQGQDRLYPPRPILAVSVAVFRGPRALIIRRAQAPLAGLYSLPGGAVEVGETLAEACLRELEEEVGVRADIVAFNRHLEPIRREGLSIVSHYVIASFVGLWRAGEARASAEADDARWIEPQDIEGFQTTPGLKDVLLSAAQIIRSR